MDFFTVNERGDISHGIEGRLELGKGGDGNSYHIDIDRENPPLKNGGRFVRGTYRKESKDGKVVLVLRGEMFPDDTALIVFRNKTTKASCFIKSGQPEIVLGVMDDTADNSFQALVLEMQIDEVVEIQNGCPPFCINYNIHLWPIIKKE